MNKCIYIFLIFMYSCCLNAQEIILDGSFEETIKCPTNVLEIGEKLPLNNWFVANKSSPDYFHTCSKFNVGVPVNFMGQVFAKDGHAYIGLILTEKPHRIANGKRPYNYREIVFSELDTTLERNNLYHVIINYCVAPHSTYALNSLGIKICKKKKSITGKLKPGDHIISDTTILETETGVWHKLKASFIATGNEKYIAIGNFLDDGDFRFETLKRTDLTASMMARIKENDIAYYFIDDVKIYKVK